MTYGARVVSIKTADKTGKVADVVLGARHAATTTSRARDAYFGCHRRDDTATGSMPASSLSTGTALPGAEERERKGQCCTAGRWASTALVWTGREVPDGVELTLVSKDGDHGLSRDADSARYLHLEGRRRCTSTTARTTDKPTVVRT